jgi:hypothetical protein
MVVYSVPDRFGDVIIENGLISWTDGMHAYQAPLAEMPIDGRYQEQLADTLHHIAVHGDTLYVVDGTIDGTTGILSFTNGTKARVVTAPDVDDVYVTDDNTLYWSNLNGLSWFGSGGQEASAYTEAAVTGMTNVGSELYISTIGSYSVPPFGALVTRSKVFTLDKGAKSTTLFADGADFIDDFVDDGHFGAQDVYKAERLDAIDGQLYMTIYLDTGSSDYDQRLVERVTASGFELAIPPAYERSELMVDGGAFYYNGQGTLWRVTPGGTPERIFVHDLYVIAVFDNYAYGFVPAISGVGYDLRRISLTPTSGAR